MSVRCSGCYGEVAPEDLRYEVVDGVSKCWDSKCYAARAEYLSMECASHEDRFGKRDTRTSHQNMIANNELNHFLNNEAIDMEFEGITEHEFFGDVGDK